MAISYIGGDTQDAAAGLALTFSIPAAAQGGDFMIAFVKQSENTTAQEWDDDGGGGNGWTRLAYNASTAGRDQETAIYYKIHSGSETDPTFTWATAATAEPMSGSLLVYRGVDAIDPVQDQSVFLGSNDANPPNPSVTLSTPPSTILAFHAATHDDISAVAPPTGFTLRTQVWSGTTQDHRNHFTADLIGVATVGIYTPPDWQHSVLNSTPEYHTYTVALRETQAIAVTAAPDRFLWSSTGLTVEGAGFEAVQGTGKIEIWSDVSGTIRSAQSVLSWSDETITFDAVQGALADNTTVFIVVTNDNGDESTPLAANVGIIQYKTALLDLSPDHYWPLDGDFFDIGVTGPAREMNSGVVGGGAFVASPIAEDTASCWHIDGVTVRREIADSPNMNVTISSQERTLACWLQVNGIQLSLGAIYKEGGAVQNLAFLIGIGNVLVAQMADTAGTRDNVQAFSDFRLAPNRPYHICMRYSHTESPAEFRLFVDGVEQQVTSGNPMVFGIFDAHSGDCVWGAPDGTLETGGTDIAYGGQQDTYLGHFLTWSDNSTGPNAGALDKASGIREVLFERGATPDFVIASDTPANMQIALDTIAGTVRRDWPLCIRVEAPVGTNDLALSADNIRFDPAASIHVQWLGTGTLTWTNLNGSDASISSVLAGGSVAFVNPPTLTLTGLQPDTEVRVYEAGTQTEVAGEESVTSGTFSASIQVAAVDIVILSLEFLYERIEAVNMSAGDVSLPIQQRTDRQYENA